MIIVHVINVNNHDHTEINVNNHDHTVYNVNNHDHTVCKQSIITLCRAHSCNAGPVGATFLKISYLYIFLLVFTN